MRGGKWHVVPEQEMYTNDVVRNRIEFDSGQDILEGALIYRIQKREASFSEMKRRSQRKRAKNDKFVQDESKHIRLLVAWYVEHTKKLHIRALLVENDGELDEHKLRILYQKYWHLLNAQVDPIENKWQLNGTTVKTKIKVMNGGYRWDVFISDKKEYIVKRQFWIDATR
jgi:hypothetical protein